MFDQKILKFKLLRFNDCDLGILRPPKEDSLGICENYPGGYHCYCPTGFNGDGRHNISGHGTGCKDIDECDESKF